MPELYQDKFGLKPSNLLPRLLRWIERCSCQFSDHVIISNHLWKDTVATRSCRNLPLTAMINNVDLNLFSRHARTRHDDRFVIVYPGSLGRHQGIDLAIDAMVEVVRAVPKAELHVYGRGPELENLKAQASRLGLDEGVRFHPSVPLSEIAGIMANADLGIVPKRADGFGNEAFSTKIMEFMSQGLPVILSRTKVDTYYFNDQCVSFFESGNSRQLAERIIDLAQHPAKRAELSRAGFEYVRKHSWEQAKHTYLDIVDQLTRTRMPAPNGGRIPSLESPDGKTLPLEKATGADAVP
jgi:glycosyltransferase involved in cell wall biosynthesis